jgi:hypothetical protein
MNNQILNKNRINILIFFYTQIASVCIVLSGCTQIAGYSNDPMFSEKLSSVYLEMFDNKSFYRGVEYKLSDALSKRIEAETPYKIVSSTDRADTLLTGQIISINELALNVDRNTGRVLEKELQVKAVIRWKNLKTGELLINNKSAEATASYSEYQNQDFTYASALAANKLAQKIVELMENQW